jgi:hypothetical protein
MSGLRGKPVRGARQEVYGQAATAERADIHTMLPAKIVSFDPSDQTAEVQIMHVPVVQGKELPIPNLKKVPVAISRGGGFAVTYPIKAGDEGFIRVAGRNLDEWNEGGQQTKAANSRMHDLSDSIFEPGGMVSKPNRLANYNPNATEVRTADGQFKIAMTEGGSISIVGSQGELYSLMAGDAEQLKALAQTVAAIAAKLEAEAGLTASYVADATAATNVATASEDTRSKMDGMAYEG